MTTFPTPFLKAGLDQLMTDDIESVPMKPSSPKAASNPGPVPVPPTCFLCPISQLLMRHPVVISSGITYDRASIVQWFAQSRTRICPVTRRIIPNDVMIDNVVLRGEISSWAEKQQRAGFNVDDLFPDPEVVTPLSPTQSLDQNAPLNGPGSRPLPVQVSQILDSILAFFVLFDDNNDGYISRGEMAFAEQQAALNRQLPPFVQERLLGRFTQLDTDSDGMLSRSEFIVALAQVFAWQNELNEAELRQMLLRELGSRHPPGSNQPSRDNFSKGSKLPRKGSSSKPKVRCGTPARSSVLSSKSQERGGAVLSGHDRLYSGSKSGSLSRSVSFESEACQPNRASIAVALGVFCAIMVASHTRANSGVLKAVQVMSDMAMEGLASLFTILAKCLLACMISVGVAHGLSRVGITRAWVPPHRPASQSHN